MRLVDRYIFRQLLGPTVMAVAALSLVALLSQSLAEMNLLVSQHENPFIFAEIILLAMPQLITLILPIAILVAALIVINRLHTEQEIVILFGAGLSPARLAAPALRLAALIALAALATNLWIQPLAYRTLRDTMERARADLVAAMVKPGQFAHPAPGLTVSVQAADDLGILHNIFIDRQTPSGRDITITAREGRLERRQGATMLVLRHGVNQELSAAGVLNFLSFDEYAFDLRPLMALGKSVRYKLSDRYLHELFFPNTTQDWERRNQGAMLAEGHARLAGPLYNLTFMVFALCAVISGPFTRLGYNRRIALVCAIALVTRLAGFAAQAAATPAPELNTLQYAVPVIAGGLAMLLLTRGRA